MALIDFTDQTKLEYIRAGLNFVFSVGNITNVDKIIQQAQHLPESSRGEIMTIAEQLIQRGREETAQAMQHALQQAQAEKQQAQAEKQQAQAEKQQIALNLLRNGLDIEFVSQNTKIDVKTLEGLLEDNNND